ncbi:MAG: hypothetical protein WDN72_09760 [Alphaproteobacteria bacterium]
MKLTRRKKTDEDAPAEAKPPKEPKPPKREKGPKPKRSGRGKGVRAGGGKKQRFILAIGDEGAILVFMQGPKVQRRLFAPSPQRDHTTTLVELMEANPTVPITVLADVIDQQYARHSFPPVSSLSVGGLVKRRLSRDFQAEDMKGFLPLGRDKTGRKEWNYLLIAVANTPLMQQWLDLIVELPNELKGIYLAPVEGQQYLPRLRRALPLLAEPAPWQLLVTHNKVSGFRQVVLQDGRLVFTRVTQAIDDSVAAVLAGSIEQEIINTLEYLRRLGFQDNASLDIIVTASADVKDALDLKRFNAASATTLTPYDIGEMLGLDQAALSADRFGDVVMAAAFATAKKRVLKFMTAYGQKLQQLYTARRAVVAVGALVAAGLVLSAGASIVSAIGDSSAASDLDAKRKPLERQISELHASVQGLGQDTGFKSAVVTVYDSYMKGLQSPLTFVHDLAPLLTPETRIGELSWGPRENNLPDSAGGGPAPAAGAPAARPAGGLDMDDGGGVPAAAAAAPAPVEIKVDMEFTHPFQDVEELSKYITDYIASLRKAMPQYHIGTGPLPWQAANGGQQSMEISFGQQAAGGKDIHDGMNKVTLYFWPQPPAAPGAAAPAAAPPGGPPGGLGGPMGMPGGRP